MYNHNYKDRTDYDRTQSWYSVRFALNQCVHFNSIDLIVIRTRVHLKPSA